MLASIDDEKLSPPFPYIGGKRKVAPLVWKAFGDIKVFSDPFCGSASVLLEREDPVRLEIINDKDLFLTNFWRAARANPEGVAYFADDPIIEAEVNTRHAWLVTDGIKRIENIRVDPGFFDTQVAGWWLYGKCAWRGREWCEKAYSDNKRVWQQLPGRAKNGINRKGLAEYNDIDEFPENLGLRKYMNRLAHRLRDVVITNGDWKRVVTPGMTYNNYGTAGIFLDPPYSDKANRDNKLYALEDKSVAQEVYEWCLENGDNSKYRIILCGYDTEFEFPDTWRTIEWTTSGGLGNIKRTDSDAQGKVNRTRERLWLSPHCLPVE